MREVVVQTAETVSTRKANESMVKIIDSNFAKSYLEQRATSATQMNTEERTQPLGLLKYFDYLFDGTIWEWDTDPSGLYLNTYYKPFNFKYYLVPMINEDMFHKYLERLV